MSLAELPPKRAHGPRCWYQDLDAEERLVADEWMADPKIDSARISRGLRNAGFTASGDSVNRHRRGDCACPR